METPGEYLSRERELRGVTVEDISLALKMSLRLVKALEHDDYESLPHPTYVKGFVRAYAVYLGIDEDDAVLRYEAYQGDRRIEAEKIKALTADITRDEPTEPTESPHQTIAWRSGGFNIGGLLGKGRRGNNRTGVIFVVAGILIVVLYFVFAGGADKPSGQVVKAPVDEINQTIIVSKESSKAKVVTAKPKVKTPVKAVKVKVKDKALPQKAATVPLVKESLKKTPADSEKKLLLEVVANDTTWMGIEIDGQEQREALLQPGETARWKATKVFF